MTREIKTGRLTADEIILDGELLQLSPRIHFQYITLTEQDILNQYVELDYAPLSEMDVIFDIIGGVAQMPGEDFSVSGNVITFTGELAAGGVSALEEGDTLRLQYRY